MFDNEPPTPSEAMLALSHPAEHSPCFLDSLFASFAPAWQFVQAALTRAFQHIARVVQRLFSDVRPHARRRPRNTRVQMVQAKRLRLNLDQDGKYPTLRSRKASYVFAYEVERWCEQKRETPLQPRDFEHRPARRRKREARRQLKWKPIRASEQERAWMDWMDASTCEICAAFGISEQFIGELSTRNVDNSARIVRATQESGQGNG
jgi:hypothetical protein